MSEKSDAILLSGPFSLKEVAFEHFQEFFDSIAEQAALTPEQQTALGEQLKASVEKRDKIGSCLAWIDAQATAIRTEEKRLAVRRASFEKFSEIITACLKERLEDWSVTKVEGLKFVFAIRKNPPSVEIENESLVPAEFIDYSPVISKARIKDAIQEGKKVPGCKLNQKTRLEIK